MRIPTRIDNRIVNALREAKRSGRLQSKFGRHTSAGFVTEALRSFIEKPDVCFSCEEHRRQLASLEIKRQQQGRDKGLALKTGWVRIDENVLALAEKFSITYGRAVRETIEQAVLESLTRPQTCKECPLRAKEQNHGRS